MPRCIVFFFILRLAFCEWHQQQLTPSFGVELGWRDGSGSNFSSELPSVRVARLRDTLQRHDGTFTAFLRHAFFDSGGLVVFRRLLGLSPHDLVALGEVLGTVELMAADGDYEANLADEPRVHEFSQVPSSHVYNEASDAVQFDPRTGRPSWHTDQSFRSPAPIASAMYCLSTPSDGSGDTLFADLSAAYESLNATMKDLVDSSNAEHSFAVLHTNFLNLTRKRSSEGTVLSAAQLERLKPVKHPLARSHHGRRALYLAPHVIGSIDGLDASASQTLVNELSIHATQDKFVLRHSFRAGDVVLWDNRRTMHAATYVPEAVASERVMWRVTVSEARASEITNRCGLVDNQDMPQCSSSLGKAGFDSAT